MWLNRRHISYLDLLSHVSSLQFYDFCPEVRFSLLSASYLSYTLSSFCHASIVLVPPSAQVTRNPLLHMALITHREHQQGQESEIRKEAICHSTPIVFLMVRILAPDYFSDTYFRSFFFSDLIPYGKIGAYGPVESPLLLCARPFHLDFNV